MKQLAHIDGLRAVAVLGVVIYHSAVHTARQSSYPSYLLSGLHGVDLFFVLSGFCLAYPTLERAYRSGEFIFSFPKYLAKRLVRILPPYYVVVCILSMCAALPYPALQALFSQPTDIMTTFREVLFIDGGTQALHNPAFWTLSIEMRWYFIFPIFLFLAYKNKYALTVCTVLIAAYIPLSRATSLDLHFLPYFLLGIIAAVLHLKPVAWVRYAWLMALGIFIPAVAFESVNTLGYHFGALWGLSAFFLVVASNTSGFLQRALSLPGLTHIGVASYSIYLVHEPILTLLENYLHWSMPISILWSLAAGLAFWYCIERVLMSDPLRSRMTHYIENSPLFRRLFA